MMINWLNMRQLGIDYRFLKSDTIVQIQLDDAPFILHVKKP
jgi:hypothetical protein